MDIAEKRSLSFKQFFRVSAARAAVQEMRKLSPR